MASRKRVLVYSPFGSWSVHTQVDAVLASSVRLRGAEAWVVRCDGIMENCTLAGRPANPRLCEDCRNVGNGFFRMFGLPQEQMRDHLRPEDFEAARIWSESLPLDGLPDAEFEGKPLGRWVLPTVYAYFHTGELDLSREDVRTHWRRSLRNGVLIYRAFDRILDALDPDFLIGLSSMQSMYRVVTQVAKARGIPFLLHERGYQADNWRFYENGIKDEIGVMDRMWDDWKDAPLTPAEFADIRAWFADREAGKYTNWTPFYDFSTGDREVRRRLAIPEGAPIVALTTSGDWEIRQWQDVYKYTFPTQIEWLKATIEIFRGRDEYLVIRHHPSNSGSAHYPDIVTFLEGCFRLNRDLPPNVRVVMPYEKLTTYSLLWCADTVITMASQVTGEAMVRGMVPVFVSESFLEPAGGIRAMSPAAYEDAIDEALRRSRAFGREDLRTAYRYCQMMMLRHSVALKSVGIKDTFGPDLRIESLGELAPGKDPALDRLCAHILSGSPSHLPPDPSGRDRAAEDALLDGELTSIRERRRKASAVLGERPPAWGSVDLAAGGDLKLASVRHPRVTVRRLPAPGPTGSGAWRSWLEEAAAACSGEFIHLVPAAGPEFDGSFHSDSAEILGQAAHSGSDAVQWAAWICDADGRVEAQAFTRKHPLEKRADLDALWDREDAHLYLLPLFVFRKAGLRRFLAAWKAAYRPDAAGLGDLLFDLANGNAPAVSAHATRLPMVVHHRTARAAETLNGRPKADLAPEKPMESTHKPHRADGGIRWTVIRLVEDGAPASAPGNGAGGGVERLEASLRRDEGSEAFLRGLLPVLERAQGEFLRIEARGMVFADEALAASEDRFREEGTELMAVAWGGRVVDSRGGERAEVLTARAAAADFESAVRGFPGLADPARLLSFFAFRTEDLRDWVRMATEVSKGTSRDLAALMYSVWASGNARIHYARLPRITVEDDASWTPLASAPPARQAAPASPSRGRYASYAEVKDKVDTVRGWLLEGQEEFLFDKVRSLPEDAVIMEVGCDQGRSTSAMALACLGTRRHIFSIDTFNGNEGMMGKANDFYGIWRGNLTRLGVAEHATGLRGYSHDVIPEWDGPMLDFVFLDGSHEYVDVLKDFQLVYPLVKPGGLIAFHDMEPGWPGPWRLWLQYGLTMLDEHTYSANLACGRKRAGVEFPSLGRPHADFELARAWRDDLIKTYGPGVDPLIKCMDISLAGRNGTPADREALRMAELAIGTLPTDSIFLKDLRIILGKDGRLDGHLLLWNAMTRIQEGNWKEAWLDLVDATRVSRPLPLERVSLYLSAVKEKLGGDAKGLPDPEKPHFGALSADGSGGNSATHYGQEYFDWQKRIGSFGGAANLFKFRDHVRPTDTVVDLGSGGGFLLRNLRCARKMGVEINPAARRGASLFSGIDSVERPVDLPDDYADVIVSNHALEHVHGPLDALKTLLPKLKVGGKLVLVVPCEPPQQAWDPKDINKHLYTWNPMTLGNLVAEAGFKVEKAEAIQHQWPPDYVQVWERLGEDGFHAACREQALRTNTFQIRVVATREKPAADEPGGGLGKFLAQPEPSHRFAVARGAVPSVADIPVALMIHRRPEHTRQVLKALEGLGVKNLFIFADAARTDADRAEVERTRQLCRSVPWARLSYEESLLNRGLAKSIMHAADRVLDRHEFMILLEDDCVPQKHFMDFMARGLEEYRDNEKVYGISGYTVPLGADIVRNYPHDAYFFPRIGSWGWATWRRAWQHIDRDLAHAYREALDKGIDLDQGGNDIRQSIEGMLRGGVKDVWTLNWVLTVYNRGGQYLYPTESHVNNIGFDGTGVHCGATTKYDTVMAEKAPRDLPKEIFLDPAIVRRFRSFYDIG